MLDRAADADGDVERRADGRAGLADLVLLADVAAVDRRAASADRSAEAPASCVDQVEVFLASDARRHRRR